MKSKTTKNPTSDLKKSWHIPGGKRVWLPVLVAVVILQSAAIGVLALHAMVVSTYTFNTAFWPSSEIDAHMGTASSLPVKLSIVNAGKSIYSTMFYSTDSSRLIMPEARLSFPFSAETRQITYAYNPAVAEPENSSPAYIMVNTEPNMNSVLHMQKFDSIPCSQRLALIAFEPSVENQLGEGSLKLAATVPLSDGRTMFVSSYDYPECNPTNPEAATQLIEQLKQATAY